MMLKALNIPKLLLGVLLISTLFLPHALAHALKKDDVWLTVGSAKARSTQQMISIPVPESEQSKNIKSIRFHVSKGNIKIHYAKTDTERRRQHKRQLTKNGSFRL